MSDNEITAKVEQARGLAKWFKLEITLSVLDHVIFHWVYPPQKTIEK